jgi:nitrate reductase NapE component
MYVRFSHLCEGYIGAARFWPIISYAMLGSLFFSGWNLRLVYIPGSL